MELVGGAQHSWRREAQETLAGLGREGWEAVSMAPWHEAVYMVLFKRPANPDPPISPVQAD